MGKLSERLGEVVTAATILVKAGVGRNIEKVEESNLAYEKRQPAC